MNNKPHIPLSRLRQLRGQARRSWINNATSSDDIFRHYVDSEVAEMTIAALRKRVAELEARGEWKPTPDWSQAPEWADWWAMDANGDGYWYESKPQLGGLVWKNQEETRYESDYARHDNQWRSTLQPRP